MIMYDWGGWQGVCVGFMYGFRVERAFCEMIVHYKYNMIGKEGGWM